VAAFDLAPVGDAGEIVLLGEFAPRETAPPRATPDAAVTLPAVSTLSPFAAASARGPDVGAAEADRLLNALTSEALVWVGPDAGEVGFAAGWPSGLAASPVVRVASFRADGPGCFGVARAADSPVPVGVFDSVGL
jgi:hypothetical protein